MLLFDIFTVTIDTFVISLDEFFNTFFIESYRQCFKNRCPRRLEDFHWGGGTFFSDLSSALEKYESHSVPGQIDNPTTSFSILKVSVRSPRVEPISRTNRLSPSSRTEDKTGEQRFRTCENLFLCIFSIFFLLQKILCS